MPLFGFTSRSSLWPSTKTTEAGVKPPTRGGGDDSSRPKTAREPVSRVNKKSPISPPLKSGTTPVSAETATGGACDRTPIRDTSSSIRGILKMNSWGRGNGGVVLGSGRAHHKRSLRSKKMGGKKNGMDPRFQDPGTASTLSMMTPSEADLSSSSSFFFVRSQRSSSFRHSSSTSPMPSTSELPRTLHRDSPLHEEDDDDDNDNDDNTAGDHQHLEHEPNPVMDEESESSSHTSLCPAPPPSSSSISLLLDESPSSNSSLESSYELKRNDRKELGFMSFQLTDLSEAVTISQRVNMPILCYRVPSSDAARPYAGQETGAFAAVWSHPLLVEAAQSLFVTVLVDRGSSESTTGMSAPPPSLDILDSSGSPLVPTLVAPSSINRRTVTRAMMKSLEVFHHKSSWSVPRYLSLLHEEEEAGGGELAVLGTDDPLLAEIEMAGLAGIVATRSGSVDKQRVVEVTYDPKRISFGCVARFALKRKVASVVYHRTNDERISAQVEIERLREIAVTKPFAGTLQPDFDPKPALRKTPLRFVPLTSLQAARTNRLVHLGRFNEAVHLLSPKQGLILMRTMHTSAQKYLHDVIDVPILPAWISVCDKQHPKHAVEQVCLCDDPTCDFENPPSYYEYNCYSTDRLPPGYPWRGF